MLQIAIVVLLMFASVGIWRWVFTRRQAGLPVIPLARRRPVPWLGLDVLFIVLMAMLVMPWTVSIAAQRIAHTRFVSEGVGGQPSTEHEAEQLLRTGDPGEILLVVIVAVFVAPLFEEFLFRVLLQGWLEALWSRRRRKNRELRVAPLSRIPILLPAILFALMHVRFGREPLSPQYLAVLFLVQIPAVLLTLGVAIVILRLGARATAADLGWQPRKLASDAKLAFVALLAAMPPLLVLQVSLIYAVKRAGIELAPDPIPLFFLALVFGFLYQRTHRIAPSLILHAAFNATSIVLFFLQSR